ncbi:ATP-binding protein [Cypionkella sp.]|uniref:ATP-binding protein n=1 Tax=Cypionkella sp. TaxID=2811411 RepID=UPI0027289984|nr:ATP-binding protein [Cypionkella sp.]MDO8986404.1 ATP-binding protein [Cypionkella sp.]MDP1575984.1 ATP-binding protein [Cypionkella sp.]MDP2048255.1 ATP-binding protein [Cypionkella sp.]
MTPKRSFLDRVLPQSVGGQLLAMLLLALAITQGLGLILLTDERNRAVRAALGLEAAGRAANVALLLDDAPADLRAEILRAADSPLARFEVGPGPTAPHNSVDAAPFLDQIRQILGQPNREVLADIHALAVTPFAVPDNVPTAMRPMHQAMMAAHAEPIEMTLSIRLAGGDWLNVRTMFIRPGLQLSPQALLPLILMVLAVVLVAWATARRVVGPMRALAVGADRLGRGLDANPLPLTGPSEVRNTTYAFNRMQDRLTRFVSERTNMLAALSHDLRSPLTAMRLRIEMLDETEDSVRLKALVEEMQVMVEATLEFARGVAKTEPAATVDLSATLGDLVADAGGDRATLSRSSPVPATVRPHALNRALRNLIDNAVRYGGGAEVSLTKEPGFAVITVADKGPGLPEDQLEAVFEPFVRLEASRSRDTGGVGLGLAIARTIIQAHGGTIQLRNRTGGGLNAIVRLPVGGV